MEMGDVTIRLTKENYNSGRYSDDIVPLGSKIGFGKVPYPSALKQRIKNKMFVSRLLKKKWRPYLKVVSTDISQPYQHTFTLKPYNF